MSGAATILRGVARTATGGALFSGSAGVSFSSAFQQLIVNPVGGILFAGGAAVGRTATRVASGGIAFAGRALVQIGPLPTYLGGGMLPWLRRRRR